MNASSPDVLVARVARGYERGRRRRAVPVALLSMAIAGAGWATGVPLGWVLAAGAVASSLAFWARWRGQPYDDGLLPGLLLGAVPVLATSLAPVAMAALGASGCTTVCFSVTAAGGLLFGALSGLCNRTAAGLGVTLALAASLAPLGCLTMTAGGTLGLLVGAPLGLVPALSVRGLRT